MIEAIDLKRRSPGHRRPYPGIRRGVNGRGPGPGPARRERNITAPTLAVRKRRAAGERHGQPNGNCRTRAHSEAFVEAHRHSPGEDLDQQRHLAMRRPVSEPRAEEPAGDDVRLPVRLTLHPGIAVPDRQQLERPDPGVLAVVVENERRHPGGLQRLLAARKALAAATEPGVGIVALYRPRPPEGVLQHLSAETGEYRGIGGLPEFVAELVVVAEEE